MFHKVLGEMIRHTIMAQISGLYTLFAAEHSGSVWEGYYYRLDNQRLCEKQMKIFESRVSAMIFLFLDTYR